MYYLKGNSLFTECSHFNNLMPACNTTRRFFSLLLFLLQAIVITGCNREKKSDGYGNFEATEIIVSAEASGRLLSFSAVEGEEIKDGNMAGVIDTTQLHLQIEQVKAQIQSLQARQETIRSQMDVLGQQKTNAAREVQRFEKLVQADAVPRKQRDDVLDQYRVIEKEILATASQQESIDADILSLNVRIRELDDRIDKSIVRNPVKGTVLVTYVEPGEIVSYGQPLYSIANLDSMFLRVYLDGTQLPHISLRQPVTVLFDNDSRTNQSKEGRIAWISSKAEFTPKIIQTKQDRVTLVYAVKISVPNADGSLKIGMPGEVVFSRQ